MKFNVPLIKNDTFSIELFNLILNNINELFDESGKIPDKVILSGPLGKEVHSFILEKNWNIDRFNISYQDGPNKIIFEYSKPIDQVIDSGYTVGSKLGEKTVNGIPDEKTMSKIISTYCQPSFKIEKTIRPKLEIILFR
jgi:hypothetical protein